MVRAAGAAASEISVMLEMIEQDRVGLGRAWLDMAKSEVGRILHRYEHVVEALA